MVTILKVVVCGDNTKDIQYYIIKVVSLSKRGMVPYLVPQ